MFTVWKYRTRDPGLTDPALRLTGRLTDQYHLHKHMVTSWPLFSNYFAQNESKATEGYLASLSSKQPLLQRKHVLLCPLLFKSCPFVMDVTLQTGILFALTVNLNWTPCFCWMAFCHLPVTLGCNLQGRYSLKAQDTNTKLHRLCFYWQGAGSGFPGHRLTPFHSLFAPSV